MGPHPRTGGGLVDTSFDAGFSGGESRGGWVAGDREGGELVPTARPTAKTSDVAACRGPFVGVLRPEPARKPGAVPEPFPLAAVAWDDEWLS